MKIVIKEKKEATEEGKISSALAGLGAAGALATAGMGMHDYSKSVDRMAEIESKLVKAKVQGPRLAAAYEKVTGKDFKPIYGNYSGELRAAIAGYIASGALTMEDVLPKQEKK